MRKRILIGSIIAVVILTLVSFTSVVGFQNVKPESIIKSPLFNIKTRKVVNKETNLITSNYIGKDGEIVNLFTTRNKNKLDIQKIIEVINGMSDEEFELFIIKSTQNKDIIENDIDENTIKNTINIIRELKPEVINEYTNYLINKHGTNGLTSAITLCYPMPFCIFWFVMGVISLILDDFIWWIAEIISIGIFC